MLLGFLTKQAELMKQTDPDRIYVENVRSFFHVPYKAAKLMCEMAVREQFFRKKIALKCPNDNCKRIIKTVDKLNPEDLVHCSNCELNEEESFDFKQKDLIQVEFYQLNR